MEKQGKLLTRHSTFMTVLAVLVPALLGVGDLYGADLPDVQKAGVLRHLGAPYANFITGSGDGLEVELVKLFAQHLGVRYEFVESPMDKAIGDLTGKVVKPIGDEIEIVGEVPIRGDILATGFTILAWREKIVDFSTPTFPTQVWLVTKAESPLQPIQPTGDIDRDIQTVKALLKGYCVLGKADTCLDPKLYDLEQAGTVVKLFGGGLNDIAPAMLAGEADYTLLDVPDTLVALKKWPGHIKIIGPLSPIQGMGYAFAKSSPQLREAFDRFFEQCLRDGTYAKLVHTYYPGVFQYFPEFLQARP